MYFQPLFESLCQVRTYTDTAADWDSLQCSWVANGDPANLCLPTTLVCVSVKGDEDIGLLQEECRNQTTTLQAHVNDVMEAQCYDFKLSVVMLSISQRRLNAI